MTLPLSGTADVTNGDAAFSVSGFTLTALTAPEGMPITLDGLTYYVASRLTTSTGTLTRNYAGSTGTVPAEISQFTSEQTETARLTRNTVTVIEQISTMDANGRGLFYNIIGDTADNDPGVGNLAFNNVDPTVATQIYLDVLDANAGGGRDVSGLIDLFTIGTILVVRSLATAEYLSFRVIIPPTQTSYRTIGVEPVSHLGSLAEEPVAVEWRLPGADIQEISLERAITRWKSDRYPTRIYYAGVISGASDSGVSGGTDAAGRTFVNDAYAYRCRQSGLIRSAKLDIKTVGTIPANNIRVQVFRPNGATYNLIATSEAFTASATGVNTFNFASPLPVKAGDVVGFWLKGGAAGECTELQASSLVAGANCRYIATLAVGGDTWIDVADLIMSIECQGIPPFIVCAGESITEGHNGPDNWHGWLHTGAGPGGEPLAEPFYRVQQLLPTMEYQNYALGSSLWSYGVTRAPTIAGFVKPRGVYAAWGVNDIVTPGTSWPQMKAQMNLYKSLLPENTMLLIQEMLPYPVGNDTIAATIRTFNAHYADWCEETGSVLIHCHDAMGKVRVSTGELDDLKDGYHYSGGHLSYDGVEALAGIIVDQLQAITWL